MSALARSVESFGNEYGKLPTVPALDFETDTPHAVQLITILMGREDSAADMQNPRQIPFLNVLHQETQNRLGIYFSRENKVAGIYDAWGNPLRVILRDPGQPAIRVTHRGKEVTVSKPVLLLSRGSDGKWGTKDDLISGNTGQ